MRTLVIAPQDNGVVYIHADQFVSVRDSISGQRCLPLDGSVATGLFCRAVDNLDIISPESTRKGIGKPAPIKCLHQSSGSQSHEQINAILRFSCQIIVTVHAPSL